MQRKYNPEQTLEKILTVSYDLFSEKGYDKTSMQDIVNALGMSKGAIFHHFKSKDDIFDGVMNKLAQEMLEQFKTMLAGDLQGLSAKEKLTNLIRFSIDENKLSNFLISRTKDPKVLLGLMQLNMRMSSPLAVGVLREGIKDGSITTEHPEQCAEVIISLLNIWCDRTLFACDEITFISRIKYLQHALKLLGADIISDDLIKKLCDTNCP